MTIQSFIIGQTLLASQMSALQANDYNQTVSTKTASYVLVAADKGTRIAMNSATATTITVNTSLFAAGDTLEIVNIGAGVCTVTAGTATVSTSGSLALVANAGGTLYFTSAGVAIFFADGVTAAAGALQLLNSTPFSASSAVNVSNVILAATATNYVVIVDCVGSSNVALNMRFRENVTDKATGYIIGSLGINIGAGTITQQGGNPLTTMRIGTIAASAATNTTTVVMSLSLTNGGTTGTLSFYSFDVSNATTMYGGCMNVSCTAITGFSLLPAAGTVTGTVRTYAYANS